MRSTFIKYDYHFYIYTVHMYICEMSTRTKYNKQINLKHLKEYKCFLTFFFTYLLYHRYRNSACSSLASTYFKLLQIQGPACLFPLHSPDLASTNFFLFLIHKMELTGLRSGQLTKKWGCHQDTDKRRLIARDSMQKRLEHCQKYVPTGDGYVLKKLGNITFSNFVVFAFCT
jgi:hypothetical protein